VDTANGMARLIINGQPVPPLLFLDQEIWAEGLPYLASEAHDAAAHGPGSGGQRGHTCGDHAGTRAGVIMTKIRAKRPSGSVSVRFAPSTALTLTFVTPEPSGPFKRTAPFSAAACMAWEPSGLMLGLGETREEVLAVMRDLHVHHVDILTLGQYLRHFAQASAGCALSAARGVRRIATRGFRDGFPARGSRIADAVPFTPRKP
jgi:hypothetical protein